MDSANTCGFDQIGDIINTDPRLGLLQDNGGETWTRALLANSPAIDQGDNSSCPALDQRGLSRPQGLACDIGAYEFGDAADLALTVAVSPDPVGLGEPMTYTAVISNLGPMTATAVQLTNRLADEVVFNTATIDGSESCHYGGVDLSCSLGTLVVGARVTGTIVVTAPLNAGLISNIAQLSAATPDLKLDNNTAVTSSTVGKNRENQVHKAYLPLIQRISFR